MATYLSNVGSLEHNLANVKNEKQTLDSRVEEIQLKITGMEGEMEILKARLETAILELERKECEVSNLKNKLNSAEIHSCSLEAALLETKSSLGTRLEILQLELAQSRASNLQVQDDLAMQVRNVLKLRQESEVLHGHLAQVQQDKDLCKMEVDKLRREAADLFHQLGNAEKRESEIISERLELLASLESLKQALADKNMENLSLTEELRKFSDFQNATEQRFKEEIEHLQNEETKWRNEFAANSALMSEKVANLRQENASLHKDLSTKIESFLELKQKIEFLTEENRRLSRKCEKTNKEISSLRDHLQILQDIVIPSSDEKIVELQNEIKYLITSNGQYIDEADRMRMLLKGAKDELLLLQQESFSSKLELIFNVEMMKHAEDLLGEAWKRNTELCEDLRSEMKQTQILEQMVASINAENEALSATLSSENATLAEGVHFLLGIIIQVAELERELVSARTDTPLRKCIDSTTENLDKFVLPMKIEAGDFVLNEDQNDDVSQYVREARVFMKLWLSEVERRLLENDEKGTSPSTLHQRGLILSIIHSLKEEVGLLQRKLHEMQLDASSIQCNNRDVSLDDIMEFSSPRKSSTASSSSILTVDDIQAGKDGIGELKDDIQRLVEENKQLKEEIISLRSKFVAAWMDQENLVESVDVPGRQLGTDMHEENEFSDVVASSGQGLLKFRIEHAPLDMEGSIAEGRKSLGIHSVKDETINGDPLVTSKKGPGSVITEGSTSDKMVLNAEASERPHIKLAQRLHQAFVDEKLEHELLELKQGRKQLKEVLRSRSQDIQRMESEIEDLEALIKEAHWKTDHNIEKKKRLDSTEEGLSELAGILTKQKEQIYKMEKEVMSTEEQKEAAAENHLSLLIELESAPGMEGWKEEQAICANEELERLRSLNRRHSLELETMNVHLQNIEAVIVSAQQQMREASSGGGGEVMASLASLNVQTRSTTIDFRSQGSQELLTPSLPHTTKELEKESTSDVGKHGISSRSSDGALGRLPLKARNLGSSWFMLMFSPERKTPRLARGSNSNKAAWRRSSRSVSGTAALDVVRRSRRKAAACLACTAPKAIRVESFDCRT
ncbi:hypothetical protein KP509_04G009800 [Ceratopteris richardii]|nr:hypothetical protein KP509_04G009800 [Ceratopteris richardii]